MRKTAVHISLILAVLAFAGCASVDEKPAESGEIFRSPELLHTSDTFTRAGEETPGFSYYTYVLAKETSAVEGWSDRERAKRAGVKKSAWTPPSIRQDELRDARSLSENDTAGQN